jgi:DNA-binding GntR family transcriptional regulator
MDPITPNAIAARLFDDIRSGALPPAAVLRQDELAARFGVSRQPIRLALQSLRAAGLVSVRPDRSLQVVGISREQLHDLVATRVLVEREALRLAIPRRGSKDVLEAAQMQQRLELETEPRLLEELDQAFHAALYRPCGNLRLLRLICELRSEDRRPYVEQAPGSANRSRWKKHHRRILKTYEAGDSDACLAALEQHLAELVER